MAIYHNGKKIKVPEWFELGTALGWTDIRSWGGRGVRGIAPGGDRHQALPRFHLHETIDWIRRLPTCPWVVVECFEGGAKTKIGFDFEAIGDDDESPCEVLSALTMEYVKTRMIR